MSSNEIARLLVSSADQGDYLFRTEEEIINILPDAYRENFRKFFLDGSLQGKLYELGWIIEPYDFVDHNNEQKNYSNENIKKLVVKGGNPRGFRMSRVAQEN